MNEGGPNNLAKDRYFHQMRWDHYFQAHWRENSFKVMNSKKK